MGSFVFGGSRYARMPARILEAERFNFLHRFWLTSAVQPGTGSPRSRATPLQTAGPWAKVSDAMYARGQSSSRCSIRCEGSEPVPMPWGCQRAGLSPHLPCLMFLPSCEPHAEAAWHAARGRDRPLEPRGGVPRWPRPSEGGDSLFSWSVLLICSGASLGGRLLLRSSLSTPPQRKPLGIFRHLAPGRLGHTATPLSVTRPKQILTHVQTTKWGARPPVTPSKCRSSEEMPSG